MSAARHTFLASGTKVAPAARYSWSVNPAVIPADFCTRTFAPSATQRRHRLGVIDTRVSPILISLGTAMIRPGTKANYWAFATLERSVSGGRRTEDGQEMHRRSELP